MSALVIYESMFGNTRLIAEAIADGFGEPGVAVVRPAHLVDVDDLAAADLVIVGAPTHAWGMPRRQTRRGAQDAAAKQPESFVVTATGGPLGEGELARAREWGKTLGLLLIRTPDTTGRRAR